MITNWSCNCIAEVNLPPRHAEMLALPSQVDPIYIGKDQFQVLQQQGIGGTLARPSDQSI